MAEKALVISRMVWVIGWSLPSCTALPGSVTSMRSRSATAEEACSRSEASFFSRAASMEALSRLARAPASRRSSGESPPSPRNTCASVPLRPRNRTRHSSSSRVLRTPLNASKASVSRLFTWSDKAMPWCAAPACHQSLFSPRDCQSGPSKYRLGLSTRIVWMASSLRPAALSAGMNSSGMKVYRRFGLPPVGSNPCAHSTLS